MRPDSCVAPESEGRYAGGMASLNVSVPESTRLALGLPLDRVGEELLLAAAMQWFESGRLSSGAAAELAGMSKPAFMQRLHDFGIPAFRQNRSELLDEIANA